MAHFQKGFMTFLLHPISTVTFFRTFPCLHERAADMVVRDAAAALVGSLGLVPSVNAGDSFVMGEPYVFRSLSVFFHINDINFQGTWFCS